MSSGRWLVPETLARFRSDIAKAPRGVAYIVHLILPHYGYLLRADCKLRDPSQWHRLGYGDDLVYSVDERDELYSLYLDQLVCAEHLMQALFDDLKGLGVYDDATIIVHGDHGSRLAQRPYITARPDELTEQDMIDHYATLLAIKEPGLAPGADDTPQALQHVFAETFLGGALPSSPESNLAFMRVGEGDEFGALHFVWPDAPVPLASRSAQDAQSSVIGELRR